MSKLLGVGSGLVDKSAPKDTSFTQVGEGTNFANPHRARRRRGAFLAAVVGGCGGNAARIINVLKSGNKKVCLHFARSYGIKRTHMRETTHTK